MPRAHNGDDFLARRVVNFLGQIGVPLVDQTRLEPGHGLTKFAHEFRQHVLLANPRELFFADLGVLEGAGQHPGGQLHLVPERNGRPCPAQGDPHVPVAEFDGNAVFLGGPGGFEEFLAGSAPELHAQALLVAGQDQVHQERGELLVADDRPQVLGLEGLFLGEGLEALAIEFDADAIRLFAFDDFPHQDH